ncbi:ankyrin repeat-containing domain protein, partial [Pterulicium gracile]
ASKSGRQSAHHIGASSAASLGRADAVITLLEYGADVSSPDASGWKAVNYSSSNGHTDLTEQLLYHGADLSSPDKDGDTTHGSTPLISASARGYAAVVSTLLSGGADYSIKDNQGRTALTIAEEKGQKEVALILRQWRNDTTVGVADKESPRTGTSQSARLPDHTYVDDVDEDLRPPKTSPSSTAPVDSSTKHESFLHRLTALQITIFSRPIFSPLKLLQAGLR